MEKNNIQTARWMPYIFIAPAVLLIAAFLVYPFSQVFYYSLQNYNLSMPYNNGFIGFRNFIDIFKTDSLFYSSLSISFKWVTVEVFLQLLFGLATTLVINQKFRGRGFTRAVIFAPWAISGVLTSMMWSLIFNEHLGFVNDLLKKVHLISGNIAWIANPKTAFGALVVAELWRGIPFFAIILLAALQNIPQEIYESCAVDGGGRWTAFTRITLPYLKDTIILSTLLRAVWEFNNVDIIYTMTGGGPANATTTLSMYVAQQAITASNFGYGSALVVISFLILLILAVGYLHASRFGQEEES
jgi:multiple sugar transport system permease protein